VDGTLWSDMFSIPEIRLNLKSRVWVIIGKERGKRPEDFIVRKVKVPK
jgi:hypothetical protein